MVLYVGDEEVWKCPKHPSKRQRSGICPTCLRDRLGSLCTECHLARPCPCTSAASTATAAAAAESSSSSSSSEGGSNLLDGEPSFRRSRSVAVPFLRRRDNFSGRTNKPPLPTSSFISLLKQSKTKRTELPKEEKPEDMGSGINGGEDNFDSNERIEDFVRMVSRSRSVSAGTKSGLFRRHHDVSFSPAAVAKGRFWNFPSPMTAFRSSKTPKVTVV